MSLASLADASSQYATNWRYAQDNPSLRLSRQARELVQSRDIDIPVLLWDEKYETQPRKLIDLLRRVSDYQLFNRHPLYAYNNPNQAYLIDVAQGKLRPEDYLVADHLFGDAGAVATKDNNFYEPSKAALIGKILEHPFQFQSRQINTEFTRKAIEEQSKAAAKVLTQALVEQAAAQGMNLDFARNNKIPQPKDANDLLNFMNAQQQVESIIHKLLESVDFEYPFQDIARKAYADKYDINAEFAFVDVINRKVVPKYYHPDQVRWMASKRIETFEDPNVLSATVMDYMTPTELINQFGVGLQIGTGIRGIKNYLDQIGSKGRKQIGYDPLGEYWTEQGVAGWGLGSKLDDLSIQGYTTQQINWMNQVFYPVANRIDGMLLNILVQRGFVRIIHEKRFKVERLEGGSLRPATDREIKYWQETNFDRDVDLRFTPVDESKKENLSGQNIKTYFRPKLWQWTRIGHDGFINVGPYEFEADPNGEQTGYVGIPIIGQISYKKSFVKIGEQDAIRVNVLHRAIDEYLVNMGVSEALIIDDAQSGNPLEYLYNAKKSSIARYDSTLMQPNNPAQLKHLTTIKLSNHVDELRVAFELLRNITTGFEYRIGAGPPVQGISGPYDGLKETQMNISNQGLLLAESHYEHNSFMNQLLQRTADVLKQVYAWDGTVNVMLSNRERELLRLTKKLKYADFDIKLESGEMIMNRLKLIQGIVQSMAKSGGAKEGDALLEVMMTNNPGEAVAIYQRLRERMEKAEQELSQAQQALQEKLAEIEKQKLTLEIQKEQMVTDREIQLQQMKSADKEKASDAKGLQGDINEVNKREQMVMNAELETRKGATLAEEQAKAQAQYLANNGNQSTK